MTNTRRLATLREDGKPSRFDTLIVYLMFGRACRWVLAVVNVFQKPTNHVSDAEQRALQLMNNRNALMRILAKRPNYLIPGTYDKLMEG